MKIYTKTGDEGKTSLVGGKRVSKGDLKVNCYGDVDELNSFIGFSRSLLKSSNIESKESIDKDLYWVQNRLFDLGGYLATSLDIRVSTPYDDRAVSYLEEKIDFMDKELEPLKHFIIPGGSTLASSIHICRSVSRRVERLMVNLREEETLDPVMLKFINRLSDYFFNLSKYINLKLNIKEDKWEKFTI
ncbi:MAG: ATP:cob(I)alamin adenosyltransferase [Candidatus Delongbacteria bacterium]|nr:MAG: ATP:cob(I)alamin adenosyltransferase [Candidatus Delongbacteria bacterium]